MKELEAKLLRFYPKKQDKKLVTQNVWDEDIQAFKKYKQEMNLHISFPVYFHQLQEYFFQTRKKGG